jgi:hypothetical protein
MPQSGMPRSASTKSKAKPKRGQAQAAEKADEFSELRGKVQKAMQQSMVDHIARASGLSSSVVQGVADGTYDPNETEARRLETGMACFNADKPDPH